MPLILCIETATTNCSVALALSRDADSIKLQSKQNYCLDLKEDRSDNYSHGELLHVFIDSLLKENEYTPADLDAVAVSAGPGSYTGLRIGISAAKGLCLALDVPLIAIGTLDSIAAMDQSGSNTTISFIDARRMEVYAAVYQSGTTILKPAPVVLDEGSFLRFRESGTTTIIGTGVQKFEELIQVKTSDQVVFREEAPSAKYLCKIALDLYNNKYFEDVASFVPLYLK